MEGVRRIANQVWYISMKLKAFPQAVNFTTKVMKTKRAYKYILHLHRIDVYHIGLKALPEPDYVGVKSQQGHIHLTS